MDYDSEMKKAIEDLESALRIRKGFMDSLVNESDWAFVIQLHALIESATTFLLSRAIGKPELDDVIASLELSGSRNGKVKFLDNLDLLDKNERRFIRFLSELRNKLVHNISNVEFEFEAYVSALDANEKDALFKSVRFACAEQILVDDHVIPSKEFVLSNPKLSIWLSGIALLSVVYIQADLQRLQREKIEIDLKFAERIRSNRPYHPAD